MKEPKIRRKEMAKKLKTNTKGITLIALVVTIIVLLILAAVAINLTLGENGIFRRAQEATEKWEEASKNEQKEMNSVVDFIDELALGDLWKVNLSDQRYTTDLEINVVSRYYMEIRNVKEYKELYILKFMEEQLGISQSYKFKNLEEIILLMFGPTMSSFDELLKYYEEQLGKELTRDEFIYELLFEVNNEDEMLNKIGYNDEKIKEIEKEYEEYKSKYVIPDKYLDKVYTIIYPDQTQETVQGKDLITFQGQYKVNENNKEYTIKVIDEEEKENKASIKVKNFVKYPIYEDEYYQYAFSNIDQGYGVRVKDDTLTEYGKMLGDVDGIKIVMLNSLATNTRIGTFQNCKNLIKAPELPEGVTDMFQSFYGCTSLIEAPKIPNSVTDMYATFENCSSLQVAPEIPNKVKYLNRTFSRCTNLIKAPEIPDSVEIMDRTFLGCTKLKEAPSIPEGVANMEGTFSGCTELIKAPEIPSSVEKIQNIFQNCKKISGEIKINSIKTIVGTFESAPAKDSLKGTGTQGSGLKVIVPNDEVRALIIKNSGYDSSKVQIVEK